MSEPDKDHAIASALASRLRTDSASSESGCPGAEVLAAYFERSVRPGDAARLEAHLVACGRCQSLLAALVRADSAGAEERRAIPAAPFFARWRWWAVPAAAGLAATLWLAVRMEPPPADLPPALARREATPPMMPEPDAPSPPQPVPRSDIPSRPRTPDAKAEKLQARVEMKALPTAEQDVAAQGAAPPADRAPEARAAVENVERETPARVPERARAATPKAVRSDMALPQLEPPGGSSVRWRLLGSAIERSTDRGRTWQRQLDRPDVVLRAGLAVSEDVCWAVGDRGMVLRTTDGTTWAQAAVPAAVDLVSVEAADALNATVVAIDGRRFVTSDGGRSWRERQ